MAKEGLSPFAIDPRASVTDAASTRVRESWTTDEKRKIDRVSKIMHEHGDKLSLRCGKETCPDPVIRVHVAPHEPTGAVLRCGCTDRVFIVMAS